MKEKMNRFMQGRYGQDKLNQFLMVLILISWVISLFARGIFYGIGTILLVCMYFRIFSKNINRRVAENNIYLKYYNKVKCFFQKQKKMMSQKKTHHFFKCPSCKQKIRVPKGKGKISITSSKCKTQFVKKS